jgi:choline dehydrogenase-like flavoprotein
MQSLRQFDYVIAGAGSAGCVLANRLSADANVRVCLLKVGGKDPWLHTPVLSSLVHDQSAAIFGVKVCFRQSTRR